MKRTSNLRFSDQSVRRVTNSVTVGVSCVPGEKNIKEKEGFMGEGRRQVTYRNLYPKKYMSQQSTRINNVFTTMYRLKEDR